MKKYILFISLATLSFNCFAQKEIERDVVANGGATSTAGSRTLEFTVGETAVAGLTSGSFLLSEGFQQGTLLITAIEEAVANTLNDILVFPVPTHQDLNIDLGILSKENVTITIYDLQGRKLELLQSTSSDHVVVYSFENLVQGTYLLEVFNTTSSEKRTWKVQKVN